MTVMKLMSNSYTISDVTSASQSATLVDYDVPATSIIIDNSAGTTPVFITSGANAVTAVFPTSSSDPEAGKVVAAGTVQTYGKDPSHKYIAAIRESGTADVYISVGSGE